MTVITQELGRLANTLGGGISDLGRTRLAGERSLRQSAALDYNLGRNRITDERDTERYALEKPGLEAQAGIEEAIRQKGTTPASWNSEMPDTYSAVHFAKYIAPELAKHYKAKWVQDDQGVSRLQRKDGSYITNFDREANKQDEIGLFYSKYKIRSTLKDQLARWEEKKQKIDSLGLPVDQAGVEKQRLDANIAEATRIMNTPEEMIKRLEDQKIGLRQMGNYPEEIKRIDNEIKYERERSAKESPKYDMVTVYGPKRRTKRVSVEKGTTYIPKKGWSLTKPSEKQTKLKPAEKAKKEALLKRYSNNLQIQKQYKAGYDEFLGVQTKFKEDDYTKAIQDNEAIMKQLEGLGVDKGTRESLLNEAIAIAQEMQKGNGTKSDVKNDPLGIR